MTRRGWLLRAALRGWVAYIAELYRGLEAASMSARYRFWFASCSVFFLYIQGCHCCGIFRGVIVVAYSGVSLLWHIQYTLFFGIRRCVCGIFRGVIVVGLGVLRAAAAAAAAAAESAASPPPPPPPPPPVLENSCSTCDIPALRMSVKVYLRGNGEKRPTST